MSSRRVAWQDGDVHVQQRIDAWLRDELATGTGGDRLHESSRRVLYRVDMPGELSIDERGAATSRTLVVKRHRTHSGRHWLRESIKHRIGASPALREWQALVDLHAAHVAVPEPLAWGVLPGGDPIVVTEFFEGQALASRLGSASSSERCEWIDRLAEAVAGLRDAGFRHGDLHLGNLHAHADRVGILDLQRARRRVSDREWLRDLAHLDFSIARAGFDVELRQRLRERLEAPSALDATARAFVRDFLRGRARREFRIGRAWSSWQPGEYPQFAGLMDSHAPRAALDAALHEAASDPRPADRRGGRTRISFHAAASPALIVAKRSIQDSWRRIALDRIRGSSALRGFRIGQRLALLGALAPRPLGALEEREPRRSQKSWLMLEAVGRDDLDRYRPETEVEALRCSEALVDWIAEWQAWGVEHLDLKASNIRIDDRDGRYRFWLVDLEDIRFRRRPSERARRRALVQLNASLADDAFSPAARNHALDRYLARLPFTRWERRDLVHAIVVRSLARKHNWQGLGCDAANPPAAAD